jgi:hypothetical protein
MISFKDNRIPRMKPLLKIIFLSLFFCLLGCIDDVQPSEITETDLGNGDLGPIEDGPLLPIYEPDGEGFFRMPWPSDIRRYDNGYIIMQDFPESRNPLVSVYLEEIEENLSGFSTSPVIYVPFERLPNSRVLPTPQETLSETSPVQLIELDGEGCGTRKPIEIMLFDSPDYFIDVPVMAAAIVPGATLKPETTYALLILRTLGTEDGLNAVPPSNFEEILFPRTQAPDDEDEYTPLLNCLESDTLSAADLAMATVFTTQNPFIEVEAMREIVLDPLLTEEPEVADLEFSDENSQSGDFITYTGTFETPIFQEGISPYNSGGGLVFDDNGLPVIQRWETVPFIVTFPETGENSFPVMIWENGTGAILDDHVTSAITRSLIDAGIAVVSFEAQFHGQRATSGSDPTQHTFNYLNPASFRTVLRQQVIDTTYFIRLLKAGFTDIAELPALNTDMLIYGGHSQGALVGGMLAGIETEISAYVLNGIGGYLSATIIERRDPVDINQSIQTILGIDQPLTRFHPVVAMAQLGGDVSDPVNYAPRWRGWENHAPGSSVFLINGEEDSTTPVTAINAITLSGSISPIDPPGWDVDPFQISELSSTPLPVVNNASSFGLDPLTIATFLDPDQGHFTIYNNSGVKDLAVGFWISALEGTPTIMDGTDDFD